MSFIRRIIDRVKAGGLRQYFLYAAGEVVLVVIGILLAMQINNWNEARKDRELAATYYCKLLEDVRMDRVLMDELIRDNELRIEASNSLIAQLQQAKVDPLMLIATMRSATARTTFTFKTSMAAWEDIKSSGHLGILESDIKDKLNRYYFVMDGYQNVVNVNSHASVTLYYSPDRDYVDMGWIYSPNIAAALDTTHIDVQKLHTRDFPSPSVRRKLTSDGVFYMGTNTRKKELYQWMSSEIDKMDSVMSGYCRAAHP